MAITTKTGDAGQTSLFGGSRVDKDHIRIECNGLIDEANSRIGLFIAELEEGNSWIKGLTDIQQNFMLIMSHIATPADCSKPNSKPHPEKCIEECEAWITELTESLKDEKLAFVLPGGNKVAALCHLVRTAIRTAERKMITLHITEPVPSYVLQYFNRLSDLFYLLAMVELKVKNIRPDKFMLFPSQKSKP